MKYFLLILILVSIYVLFSYGRIFYYIHYSKNPSIQQTDQQIGQATNAQLPPLRYIAAGDSTAVGEGASSIDQTYPVKIANALASAGRVVDYKNVAVSGAKTRDVISSQLSQIIEFNPDIITISITPNDATHLISQKTILKNYQQIIDTLSAKTTAQIYITNTANFNGASLIPWPYIQLLEYRSKSTNAALSQLGTDRVHIINIHDFGWDKFPDRSVTYSFDYFHPSDIGYQNWTDAFLDQIKPPQQ